MCGERISDTVVFFLTKVRTIISSSTELTIVAAQNLIAALWSSHPAFYLPYDPFSDNRMTALKILGKFFTSHTGLSTRARVWRKTKSGCCSSCIKTKGSTDKNNCRQTKSAHANGCTSTSTVSNKAELSSSHAQKKHCGEKAPKIPHQRIEKTLTQQGTTLLTANEKSSLAIMTVPTPKTLRVPIGKENCGWDIQSMPRHINKICRCFHGDAPPPTNVGAPYAWDVQKFRECQQIVAKIDKVRTLLATNKKQLHGIVGSFLNFSRCINSNILTILGPIGTNIVDSTEHVAKKATYLLNY